MIKETNYDLLVEISVEINEVNELFMLRFREKEKEGSAVITLNLQETQLLCILLSETITKVLAKRLQLNVLPEVLH